MVVVRYNKQGGSTGTSYLRSEISLHLVMKGSFVLYVTASCLAICMQYFIILLLQLFSNLTILFLIFFLSSLRIYQFQNFAQMKKKLLSREDDDGGALV